MSGLAGCHATLPDAALASRDPSGATRRKPRPPCTSAPWRHDTTPRSTQTPPAPAFAYPKATPSSGSKSRQRPGFRPQHHAAGHRPAGHGRPDRRTRRPRPHRFRSRPGTRISGQVPPSPPPDQAAGQARTITLIPPALRARTARRGPDHQQPTSAIHAEPGVGQPRRPCPWPHRTPRSGAAQAATLATRLPPISAVPDRYSRSRLVTAPDRHRAPFLKVPPGRCELARRSLLGDQSLPGSTGDVSSDDVGGVPVEAGAGA